MKQRSRKIYFVDRSVQGALMLRFVGYWVLCLAIMFMLLAAVPVMLAVCFPFGERPSLPQILADTWAMFWPAMAASLLVLPAVLWDLLRSMGIPPSHLKSVPKGLLKRVFLPIQYSFAFSEKATNIMMGKSQLEVWGAAMRTNLGMSGRAPSDFHPDILSKNNDIHRMRVRTTGVSNMV